MSFKKALLIITAVPLVLLFLFFLIYFWRKEMRLAQVEASKALQQNLSLQLKRTESHISNLDEICRSASAMLGRHLRAEDVDTLTPEDVFEFLKRIVGTRPEVTAAGIAVLERHRLTHPGPFFYYAIRQGGSLQHGDLSMREIDLRHRDYEGEEWFSLPVRTGKPVWLRPQFYPDLNDSDDALNGWGMTFSLPLFDETGEALGVICVGTMLSRFTRTMMEGMADLGVGAYCAVVGPDGGYYMHPDAGMVLDSVNAFTADLDAGGANGGEAVRGWIARREGGVLRVMSKKRPENGWMLMAQTPLRSNDWTLVVLLPEDNFLGSVRTQLYTLAGVLVVATVVALAITMVALHVFSRPLADMEGAARSIATGDHPRLEAGYGFREFDTMADAFNWMNDAVRERNDAMLSSIGRLDNVITHVSTSAGELTQVAEHVSSRGQQLSAGAVQQEAVFSRLFDAMARLKEHADSTSEMARKTNAIISEVENLAVAGNCQMRQLSGAMQEISGSSASINNALKFIDNIAFQTNILALNAAVEAARAGRHGLGFNVVASEVRLLANRSAGSVVNTEKLLQETDGKIESGVELAGKTSEWLHEIENIATSAAQMMGQVTEKARDQSDIIGDVIQGLKEVSEITKRNVNDASANAAVSEELLVLANQMHSLLRESSAKRSPVLPYDGPEEDGAEEQ